MSIWKAKCPDCGRELWCNGPYDECFCGAALLRDKDEVDA